MNDVARSVVMGAAMISPALLAACRDQAQQPPTQPEPLPTVDTSTATATDSGAPTTPTATATPTTTIAEEDPNTGGVPTATAPPTATVRPRTIPTAVHMPTRGFAGAVRARR
jgi:hypothetical protein